MSIDPQSIAREDGRYVYRFKDGSEAELVFVERPAGTVTITHTFTPPQHRGRGVAATLVAHAVEDFRTAGHKVVPACSFARGEFKAHPEWAGLLANSERKAE